MNTINDEGLVKLFDSLAIVMTLSDDPGRFDVGWMNLKQHTNLNLDLLPPILKPEKLNI